MAKFLDIEKFLQEKNIDFKIIDLPETAISVDDVVRLSGGKIKREEIIKTLIVKLDNGKFVGCLLKGEDRLKKKIAHRFATEEEVIQLAKVKPGAVCPILLGIPMVIDEKVTKLKRVNMGSGDHLKGLELNFRDLLKVLPEYTIGRISE